MPDPDAGQVFKFYPRFDKNGLINMLISKYGFNMENIRIDKNNNLIDPWGDPYQYVLGDGKHYKPNRKRLPNDLPYDSNKPKHATLPAAQSDWNSTNQSVFPYVYSFGGGSESTSETWIYVKG
jgi:hypothetical protein